MITDRIPAASSKHRLHPDVAGAKARENKEKASRISRADDEFGPGGPDVRKLGSLIGAHTPYDGSFELCVPGVYAVRWSRPHKELVHGISRPGLCIVAQGAKSVMAGQEVYAYDASRMIVFSIDVPVAGQVTRATHAEPFLALKLDLDPHKVAELTLRVYPQGLPKVREHWAIRVWQADTRIVDAATRLIELMAHPDDAQLLAPLVIDEILIRLLRSPVGSLVAQIGHGKSRVQRIATAIAWVRANFAQPMNVESLAALLHMSVSSFHQHFRAVTSMSPLQYQKVLRLQEARRLMLSLMMDASAASRQVGYVSASQFTREYGRYFGSSPTRDIAKLREQGLTAAEVSRETAPHETAPRETALPRHAQP
jgi:AraC-like DNA-binding protein